jgi:hypothetical protein
MSSETVRLCLACGRSQSRSTPASAVRVSRSPQRIGRAQFTGLAEDLPAWTDDFYQERARDAEEDLPATDVTMMQGDGKGIAMRPEHRKNAARLTRRIGGRAVRSTGG